MEGATIDSADSEGCTALRWASEKGHAEIVELLLDAGAEPDKLDKKGYTPLMMAAYGGHMRVACALIRHGAEVDLHTPPVSTINTFLPRNVRSYSGFSALLFGNNASLFRWPHADDGIPIELWRRSE